MAIQQHRRQYTQLHMSPYNSDAGRAEKELGETLSGIGQVLASAAKTVKTVGAYDEERQKRIEDEKAKAAGLTGTGGTLTDEAQAKLADAQLGAFEELSTINNRIREKYRDAPDGEKMNAELHDAYETVRSKYEQDLDSAALKSFRKGIDSNMKEFVRANYSDARSRKAAIASKKERELKKQVSDAQQAAIYNAGRQGAPLQEVASRIIPEELQKNPNMPVSPAVKRQVEAIPALYVAGAIDKPAYDEYDANGQLEAPGIISQEQVVAPINFDKIIDDYYDKVIDDIDALPGLTDYQRKKFTEKADLAREMRKQDFARYMGEYKRGATADFMRDPQSDMLDSALFHRAPDGFIDTQTDEQLGENLDGGTQPKIQWEETPVKKEMQRMADNAYKPSKASTPKVKTAARVVKKLQIPEALDESEMEQQSEFALKNVNDVLEDPTTTNEERIAARKIAANSLEDPEVRQQTNELFAKAQILDMYADLFGKDIETDEAFDVIDGLTGITREGTKFERTERSPEERAKDPWWKRHKYDVKVTPGKAKDFDYNAADERNRAKYNLVRDTYLNVLDSAAKGEMDKANAFIDNLPYNVAKINYGGQLSAGMIDQFRVIDQEGDLQKRPEFMYKGYNFEYLGMDKTGVILARRKL